MRRGKFVDPRGAHVRLHWRLLDSPAWNALLFSQQALYVACRRKLTSNNNGNLEFTLSALRERGFTSSSTLASGLRALVAVGLIAVTREGGRVGRGQTIPVLYRFTDEVAHEWRKLEIPAYQATDDWRKFESIADARGAIDAAEQRSHVKHSERVRKTKERSSGERC